MFLVWENTRVHFPASFCPSCLFPFPARSPVEVAICERLPAQGDLSFLLGLAVLHHLPFLPGGRPLEKSFFW